MQTNAERIDSVALLAQKLRRAVAEFNSVSEQISLIGGKVTIKLASGAGAQYLPHRAIDVDVSVIFEV